MKSTLSAKIIKITLGERVFRVFKLNKIKGLVMLLAT